MVPSHSLWIFRASLLILGLAFGVAHRIPLSIAQVAPPAPKKAMESIAPPSLKEAMDFIVPPSRKDPKETMAFVAPPSPKSMEHVAPPAPKKGMDGAAADLADFSFRMGDVAGGIGSEIIHGHGGSGMHGGGYLWLGGAGSKPESRGSPRMIPSSDSGYSVPSVLTPSEGEATDIPPVDSGTDSGIGIGIGRGGGLPGSDPILGFPIPNPGPGSGIGIGIGKGGGLPGSDPRQGFPYPGRGPHQGSPNPSFPTPGFGSRDLEWANRPLYCVPLECQGLGECPTAFIMNFGLIEASPPRTGTGFAKESPEVASEPIVREMVTEPTLAYDAMAPESA